MPRTWQAPAAVGASALATGGSAAALHFTRWLQGPQATGGSLLVAAVAGVAAGAAVGALACGPRRIHRTAWRAVWTAATGLAAGLAAWLPGLGPVHGAALLLPAGVAGAVVAVAVHGPGPQPPPNRYAQLRGSVSGRPGPRPLPERLCAERPALDPGFPLRGRPARPMREEARRHWSGTTRDIGGGEVPERGHWPGTTRPLDAAALRKALQGDTRPVDAEGGKASKDAQTSP